ncbi:MAG: hypothetical protein Q7K57_44635 [Burkholderiaceae bacterium]|nr:hypothetical protein [Burkholderiaceae bacterium]
MSVSVQTPYKKYTAAAAATVFPTTFRVVLAGDLQVTVDSVVVTTGFTLSTLGLSAGVDVTFTTPMVGGEVVELQRIIPKSRVTDYQQLGDFDAAVVNADIDRLWMSNQELGEEVDRAVKVPIGSTIDPDQLIADLLAAQAAAEAAAAETEADKLEAAASAAAAAASAATTGLPSLIGKALNWLRVKADESGYETRTPAQALADIGGVYRGHIDGLILSNNATDATNDIDIASGSAVDTTATYMMSLTGPFTKRLDAAWAAGSGNGGLDAGSIADAEYNVWLIRKDSDGSRDVLFSLSATAPTMPTGYTAKRRIRSIFRASGAIRLFVQKGDRVYYKTPPLDVDTTLGTTATSYTISAPGGSVAILNAFTNRTGNTTGLYIYSPEVTDQAHSESASPLSNFSYAVGGGTTVIGAAQVEVLTNSSAQIRAVAQLASTTFKVATVGYIDTRGRDA